MNRPCLIPNPNHLPCEIHYAVHRGVLLIVWIIKHVLEILTTQYVFVSDETHKN